MPPLPVSIATLLVVLALGCAAPASEQAADQGGAGRGADSTAAAADAPTLSGSLEVDPFWPQALPHNWLLGHVIGVAVDSRDHIWVLQRPRSLTDSERGASLDPPTSECCVPAPAVLEFDQAGNVVQGWGGPGDGYDWPNEEHGIFVDHMDNVWIGGNGQGDGQVLKFARDGTFLLQIGSAGPLSGSDDTTRLGRAADFVADGYGNRRVIVFDADTGEYLRHWGAYGNPPVDGDLEPYGQQADPSPIFGDTVHCVQLSNEGLVYVCDRMNHRLQIFEKDGTFVREGFIGRATAGASVWDIAFSADAAQTYLYNADGGNHLVWTVRHESLETRGTIGRRGRMAGQFESTHSLAVDSFGNLYVGETLNGRRVQKFRPRSD